MLEQLREVFLMEKQVRVLPRSSFSRPEVLNNTALFLSVVGLLKSGATMRTLHIPTR